MRTKIALSVLALMLVIAACSGEKQAMSLVTSAGTAPYYTDLADALEAARADQYVVVDFYTDW